MPVPWNSKPYSLPNVCARGCTIKQLREFKTFVQRLCKVGLLRDGETRQPIHWFDLDMYQITDLVLKPLIEYMEDEVRGTGGRYSWAEFVATGEQYPQLHIIHSWSGRFRDFMASVDRICWDRALPVTATIWVCTFAYRQFGEYFGIRLLNSPCFESIRQCQDGSVLIVDRDAASLLRIWCGLELFVTMQSEKELRIYTSAGMIGKDVKTGSLVEALQSYDVTLCEASEEGDRRHILNFLCGGESAETNGLEKTQDGSLVLIDGWKKQLDGDETTTVVRSRYNGLAEYLHESHLIKQHEEVFMNFNSSITHFVQQAFSGLPPAGQGEACNSAPAKRGLRLGYWRSFATRVRNWADHRGLDYNRITIDTVARKFVTEVTSEEQSYSELFGNKVVRPQYLIDEPKMAKFAELVSMLEWFAEAMRLDDDVVIWCQVVCIRQRDIANEFKDWHDHTLPTILKNCDGMVSFMPEDKELIVRANRMLAWQICFESAKPLYLGCKDGILSCGASFAEGGWVFGQFDPTIALIIIEANWAEAASADPKLGELVLKRIKNAPGGLPSFAGRLCRVAAGPVLRSCASSCDPAALSTIRRLCRHEAVMLTSGATAGCLRETATHIAASHGNIEVLHALLDLHADPNAEDNLRETPLHWAAITGEAKSVKVLLRYGARAGAESAFAETPLMVAQENMTAFLGRSTAEVVALLESWEAIDDDDSDSAGQDDGHIHKEDGPDGRAPTAQSSASIPDGRAQTAQSAVSSPAPTRTDSMPVPVATAAVTKGIFEAPGSSATVIEGNSFQGRGQRNARPWGVACFQSCLPPDAEARSGR